MIILFSSFFVLLSNVACTTMWAGMKTKDRSYKIETYFDDVISIAFMGEKFLIAELSRTGTPKEKVEELPATQQVCFSRKNELAKPLGLYLGSNKEKRFYCPDKAPIEDMPQLERRKDLEKSLLIPELNIAVSGLGPNSSATAFCDCKNLKGKNYQTKAAYHFDKYLFYLELTNGKWLRFSKGKRNPILNYFKVEEVAKEQFLAEKRKPKPAAVTPLDPGGYLFVQLATYRKYAFYSNDLKFGSGGRLNRILFRRNFEGTVEEKGNKLYYALFPFTVAFDVVTSPIQLGFFIYNMGKANKNN